MLSLSNLIETKTLNRSNYSNILGTIISANTPSILEEWGSNQQIDCVDKTKIQFYTSFVENKITEISNDEIKIKKFAQHTIFKCNIFAGDANGPYACNISTWVVFNFINKKSSNVTVTVTETNKLSFGIFGSDLKPFIRNMPTYINKLTGTRHGPLTLSDFTKVYPEQMKQTIVTISVNLMLFRDLLISNQIELTDDYIKSSVGYLGREVDFEIPTMFSQLLKCKYLTPESIYHENNPYKISNGLFNFNKNGIVDTSAGKIIKQLAQVMDLIGKNNIVYPVYISSYDVSDFIQSINKIAICGINKHARTLIKYEDKILIVDPWMDFLPRIVCHNLTQANKGVQFVMIKREIKDQAKNEGSCVLCAIVRALFIATNYEWICDGEGNGKSRSRSRSRSKSKSKSKSINKLKSDKIINISKQQIPDFYAYLTAVLYRQSLYKSL